MKLSLFTDIGLQTLMWLACHPGRLLSTRELAEELAMSHNHLTKVVSRLAKAGFVAAKRGNRGGILLARPAEEIRIGDVVAVLEAETRLVECFKTVGTNCVFIPGCKLAPQLAKANRIFIESLNQTTLSDVACRS